MVALSNILEWIKEDYETHPLRFVIETLAWALSIGCSVIVTATVPQLPFMLLYPMWLSGCAMYAWAAWTRGSFGMFCNYMLLISIDVVGFARVLTN